MRSAASVASTVALVWSALFGMVGLALGVPAIERNGVLSGQAAFHLLLAALAIALGYSGYRLRQHRSGARFALITIGTVLVALAFVVPAPLLVVDAAVNLVIIALVVRSWGRTSGAANPAA